MRRSLARLESCLIAPLCVLLCSASVRAQTLDQYGGYIPLTGHNMSGYFRIERIDDRYYLITPDNHAFISMAFDTANYNDTWGGYCPTINSYPNPYGNRAKYNNSNSAWETAVKANMARWGFNSLGAWCQRIANVTENVTVLSTTGQAQSLGVPTVGSVFADVYDPRFAQAADQVAKGLSSQASSRYRIGAFPDNELHWSDLPNAYIAQPATTIGKQYWAGTLLPGRYATIDDLNAAYGASFTSFTGSESTSLISAASLPNDYAHPAIFEDKKDFAEDIADKYYSICTAAMRTYDLNHLVFSARWALWANAYDLGYPEAQAYNERIWKKAGQYCDIIAINSYSDNIGVEANHRLYSRVFTQAKKPFMITEWASFANDTQFVNTAGWRACQRQRGEFYFDQMKFFMDFAFADPNGGGDAHPCMGTQWFQYNDEPSLGRPDGERVNFGLLNVKDEPYVTLVDTMGAFNAQAYDYVVNSRPLRLLDGPTLLTTSAPPFQWNPVAGAVSYTVLYSPEKCFPEDQTVRIEGITGISYTPSEPPAAGLWYWCVRGVDTSGYGGRYGDPVSFRIDKPSSSGSTVAFLGFESLAGWQNTALEESGWDGTVWAFRDVEQKTTGSALARVVFTVNSLNKHTGLKNAQTSKIHWWYVGRALPRPLGDQIRFDVRTARAVDSRGVMTVASKYVSVRVMDMAGQVLLDTPLDPGGTMSPLVWRSLSFPLTTPHDRDITTIEFYVDTAAPNVPWDQRLVVWVDNMAITPSQTLADLDNDSDVDLTDFALFQTCFSGPNRPLGANCLADADFDGDGDVDLMDFSAFQGCFNGPNRPPRCGG